MKQRNQQKWAPQWTFLLILTQGLIQLPLTIEKLGAEEPVTGKTSNCAEIRVVDADTGRGVPLVELQTVNGLLFVTDNAGRIAFQEPDLLGQEVYLTLRSHGYVVAADGFGYTGVRVTPRPHKPVEITVQRSMLAERLCRLTGEGLWRDSLLLGHAEPPSLPNTRLIGGQDSIEAVVYRGRTYYFWGDTLFMNYPLGLFRTAGATTAILHPDQPVDDPARGIPYQYFLKENTAFPRAMMPLPERPDGVIWISGVCVVPAASGEEKMIAHYSRRRSLEEELEQGIAVFNDERQLFEPVCQLELNESWRKPSGHPVKYQEQETTWLLFGKPVPQVRVPCTYEAVLDPRQYAAYSCAQNTADGKGLEPARDAQGQLQWKWQQEVPPVDSAMEHKWLQAGQIQPSECRSLPADIEHPEDRVQLHSGSVCWNRFRERWVLLAGQIGGTSLLGEVWYSEAKSPLGPFTQAIKVVTHERQSFYNVCQHDFLDQKQGQFIHFEGTYTRDFSGNTHQTPRYNYNQMLYRLDVSRAAAQAGFE